MRKTRLCSYSEAKTDDPRRVSIFALSGWGDLASLQRVGPGTRRGLRVHNCCMSFPVVISSEPDSLPQRLSTALLALVAHRPASARLPHARPAEAAREAARQAASKAALAAGALALPPGPLGWLTLLPEMAAVWRIQSQLVADIAAIYGRSAELGREQMLYCLFRHTAAQAVRDLSVRVGERLLIRPATTMLLQQIVGSIGARVSEQLLRKAASRWVPLLGAAAVGAYAYYDTSQVAAAAIELFESEQAPDKAS
jgi:hypothetical protein